MNLPDVNILLHAFWADSSEHENCRTWLDGVIDGDARYGMAPQVLSSVVRITTHPKIFAVPISLEEVLRYCDILLYQPHCVTTEPGERHWQLLSAFSSRRTHAATYHRMHVLRHWPSSPAANGSHSTTITPGSRV